MPRQFIAIPLAILSLLLAGCAGFGGHGLVVGQSGLDDVLRVMGEPALQWRDADGSRQFAYPRGPAANQTFMVRIGADGKLRAIENVLTADHFRRIEPGMDQARILRLLGPSQPEWTTYFRARDELVWEWPYCDDWNQRARFDVLFDASKGTVRSTMSRREDCRLQGICWCSH